MAISVRAETAAAPSPARRQLRLAPRPSAPAGRCARTIDVQFRALRDHRAAAQRRDAFRRARSLCEDLAEQLPQRAAVCDEPTLGEIDRAHELKLLDAELRATTGELAFLATRLCDRPRPATSGRCPDCRAQPCRCMVAGSDTLDLDEVVERLDDQLRDAEHGYRGAGRRVVDLAAILLAGVHGLSASAPSGASPAASSSPAAPSRCAHCGHPCDRHDDCGVFFCSAEHLLLARISGAATAALTHSSERGSSSTHHGSGAGAAAEA